MGHAVDHKTKYLLDTDKLRRLSRARGMTDKDLWRQMSECYGLNLSYKGFNRLLLNQNSWLLTYAWVIARSFDKDIEELFRPERDAQSLAEVVRRDLAALAVEEQPLEGAPVGRHINTYERSASLREAAIHSHGTVCQACGFNFMEVYGERGKGFIEVHHIHPLSDTHTETQPDPKNDMRVLCANCHRMVHRRPEEVLSLEELQERMQQARQSRAGK